MHMLSTKYSRVAPLHLHVLSQRWWDAHPGASNSKNVLGRMSVWNMRKSTTDCFHVCYSPFVYEPIWWLLQHVAPRGASGLSPSRKTAALGMAAKKAAKKAAAAQTEAKQKTKQKKAKAVADKAVASTAPLFGLWG